MSELARRLRKQATPAEKILWHRLWNKQLNGLKFRRQHPIGKYVVDFYCADLRLIIEVDGEIHKNQYDQDQFREEWLKANGYFVIRFTNQQVINEIESVLSQISIISTPKS
ncbi:MAG: restriction endonuclease [Anaerolineaceae bacterium]|nr:restriction endonuclease [Anaerolineaceae bacterium]